MKVLKKTPALTTVVILLGMFSSNVFAQSGELDSGFGNGGKVIINVGDHSYALATCLQNDSKILIAGYTTSGAKNSFLLLRLNTNGSIDNSFGQAGIVVTQFSNLSDERANALALQKDGKILLAGSAGNQIGLARFNSDGLPDNSFGVNGKVKTLIGDSAVAQSIAIQPDNKIVVGGYSYYQSHLLFAAARYHSDGSLDQTFGVLGKITAAISTPGDDICYSIKLQPDGKIILGGRADPAFGNTGEIDMAIARFNTNGIPDSSFSVDGKVTASYGISTSQSFYYWDEVRDLLIQPDMKILGVGFGIHADYNHNSFTSGFALVRYNKDGIPDSSFGINGKVKTSIGSSNYLANAVILQPDQKIVVGGYFEKSPGFDFVLIRYNKDGSVDNRFGLNGIVSTHFSGVKDYGWALGIQDDGKLILSGWADSMIAVARYQNDLVPNWELCNPIGNTILTTGLTGSSFNWQLNDGSGFKNLTENTNYSGTTNDTLHLYNISSVWNGYQYRCIIDSQVTKVFTIKFINKWTGMADSNWYNNANWSCGQVPDANTDVIINSGIVLLDSSTNCKKLNCKSGGYVYYYDWS